MLEIVGCLVAEADLKAVQAQAESDVSSDVTRQSLPENTHLVKQSNHNNPSNHIIAWELPLTTSKTYLIFIENSH